MAWSHQIKRSTHQEQGAERKMNTNRIEKEEKPKFSQMMHMSGSGSLDACGCGAELIFVSQDKFTCCQWAASMQELQFLCYPHNSLLLGCRSGPRRGELERREGEEDEPPLDFLSKEEEERECPPLWLASVSGNYASSPSLSTLLTLAQ
jgi:hypothetical protein